MPWIAQFSSKKDVQAFLEEMRSLLERKDFNIDTDFVFQEIRLADDPKDKFTNEYTMNFLHYDSRDIVEILKSLTVSDYSESMMDTVADQYSVFYVFGKEIKEREIYIKVRIKKYRSGTKVVFCLSFHFARQPIVYRYK